MIDQHGSAPLGGSFWDQRYGEDGFAYGTRPNDFIADHAGHLPKGSPVLCIGAGEGRNAVYLASLGLAVTAVDLSQVGLVKAAKLAAERGLPLTTVQADLQDYDLGSACWGGVVSVFCHLPPPLRRDVYRRVATALEPGGVLLLEAYTPRQLQHRTGGPPVAQLLYELADLREDLRGLSLLRAEELERDVVEGRHHHGRAAVVQIIAQRAAAAAP